MPLRHFIYLSKIKEAFYHEDRSLNPWPPMTADSLNNEMLMNTNKSALKEKLWATGISEPK
jgi:hypothetical protein